MTNVGVVGLGMIGGALARRLVDTGDAPVVFDVVEDALTNAEAGGAIGAGSAAEVASRCEIVFVCVQNDAQAVQAIAGPDGLLDGARAGSCIGVVSTVLPATVIDLADRARTLGVSVVDVPVAGQGMVSVEEGTMQVFVGDDGELLARLEPTLRRFCGRIVAAGGLGSGSALKLAHNVIVYAGFAASIEAIELAEAAGVRSGLVEDVAQASGALGRLAAFTMPFYHHARDDPHGPGEDEILRGAAELLEKDLSDAIELGRHHGVELPIAELLSRSGASVFPFDPDAEESHRDPSKSTAQWFDEVLDERAGRPSTGSAREDHV